MRKFKLSLIHLLLPGGGNALSGLRDAADCRPDKTLKRRHRAVLGLTLGIAWMPFAEAAPSAQQQLLQQVRLGEASHREDLVRQSLYRLELIDPNNPEVVAARFRYQIGRAHV